MEGAVAAGRIGDASVAGDPCSGYGDGYGLLNPLTVGRLSDVIMRKGQGVAH